MRMPNPFGGYSQQARPFAQYGALMALFNVAYAGAGVLAARRRGGLPDRYSPLDVALVGTATHKLSRLIAKDKVTTPLRAPFARHKEDAPHGEVDEEPRGEGVQRAVGELITCPFCLGLWIAASMTIGMVAAPRATRMVAFTLSTLALSDLLQIAYRAAGDAAAEL